MKALRPLVIKYNYLRLAGLQVVSVVVVVVVVLLGGGGGKLINRTQYWDEIETFCIKYQMKPILNANFGILYNGSKFCR
jgi:hypothetical protein